MANLHNRISRKELKKRMGEDQTPRSTVSFYRYTEIPDPTSFRNELYKVFREMGVLGRIYIASEGINAQVNIPTENLEKFRDFLDQLSGFRDLMLNPAVEDKKDSFYVLDIKVRKKIVADGIDDPGFNMKNKGGYVTPEEFNQLTNEPGTLVIDMRNHYEYEVGHFEDAIEIPSDTFREQLPMAVSMLKEDKERNIIMYCTGGIRCEKASAYMLHHGFKNVFHLHGGIINYARSVKNQSLPNKFIGKNFVFDERLGERITDDIISNCHQCGKPCDTHVNCANNACHLLFIQCGECSEKFEGCCSSTCQDFIHLPDEQQKALRKGIDKGRNVFNKAKSRKGKYPTAESE